jgi:hypothetical protein
MRMCSSARSNGAEALELRGKVGASRQEDDRDPVQQRIGGHPLGEGKAVQHRHIDVQDDQIRRLPAHFL